MPAPVIACTTSPVSGSTESRCEKVISSTTFLIAYAFRVAIWDVTKAFAEASIISAISIGAIAVWLLEIKTLSATICPSSTENALNPKALTPPKIVVASIDTSTTLFGDLLGSCLYCNDMIVHLKTAYSDLS